MFTPTCKALAAIAVLGLTGCETGNVTRSAPAGIRLPDGLVVAGAHGWCVDVASTQRSQNATVVIFGSCAALTSNALQPRPTVPGIVTVSVEGTPSGSLSVASLETFLRSPSGRAALSRDGNARSVTIIETETRDNALVLHAVDQSSLPGNTAEEYWRALFEIDGRIVTVSLVAVNDRPVPDAQWKAALDAQIFRLRSANAR